MYIILFDVYVVTEIIIGLYFLGNKNVFSPTCTELLYLYSEIIKIPRRIGNKLLNCVVAFLLFV